MADLETIIDAEPIPDGEFSDYGSSIESETRSLASSLETYLERNGRKYHTYFGENKNPMPCDAKEQERLDICHEIIHFATGGILAHAPVHDDKRIQHVLDLGTGTGMWAIEFAQQNPHSNVVGLDLTPMQPGWVPPNCRFEVDDFELKWTFRNKFDFIHARMVTQCVSDWRKVLDQAYENLNPGGWMEIGETGFVLRSDDNSIPNDYPAAKAFTLIKKGLEASGRLDPDADSLRYLLHGSGFVNVTVKTYKFPVSPWPKDPDLKQAGGLYTMAVQTGYEAYLLDMCTRVMGMDESEILDICRKAYECHLDRRQGVHAYFHFYFAYGQKPE